MQCTELDEISMLRFYLLSRYIDIDVSHPQQKSPTKI